MNNAERRQLLDRFRGSGMEGSILDVFKAYEQGQDLIAEHYQQKKEQEPVELSSSQEQKQGLRPYHEAGDLDRSAVFKDVPPNTPFNTHGMKVPVNIEKYNEQGHLVESHKSVPPGISNIPTGPHRGDVIETPAKGYRDGGVVKYAEGGPKGEPAADLEGREDRLALAAANQQNRFTSPATQKTMKEDDPRVEGYIEDTLFKNVGYKGDSVDDPWSAAAVSDLAVAFDPEFKGSAAHSQYINRAFKQEGNYRAEKITSGDNSFAPGDILFQGRRDKKGNPIGPQNFRQFKRAGKGKGKYAEGYGSHSDIITSTGVDKDGRKYYNVQGGNVGNTLSTKRMYAEDIKKSYPGRLTQDSGLRSGGVRYSNKRYKR